MKIEYTLDNEIFYDYTLSRYVPSVSFVNKFKSSNLLIHSFDRVGCSNEFYDLTDCISNLIGANQTVWGIKKLENESYLSWEYYFYNPNKKPWLTATAIFNNISRISSNKIILNEKIPYFMFSFELNKRLFAQKNITSIDVYNSSFSYLVTPGKRELKNHYSFYRLRDAQNLIADIKRSYFIDFSIINLREILLPELIDCYLICRAHKKECDAIYFSRININQFLFFLKRFNYPKEIIYFVKKNKNKLNHLRYDVGFDYKMDKNKLKIIKSGYYGTF